MKKLLIFMNYKAILFPIWFITLWSIFYFSWVPSPNLGQTGILPTWLSQWTDSHYNLRTSVPFFIIGLLSVLLQIKNSYIIGIGIVVVILVESVQLLLPERHFDVKDIAYAVVGLGFGMIIGLIIDKTRKNIG